MVGGKLQWWRKSWQEGRDGVGWGAGEGESMSKEMSKVVEMIKKLRERVGGATIGLCKEAIEKKGPDNFEGCEEYIKKNMGMKSKEMKVGTEGVIRTYTHHNGKIGAMVEIGVSTDFAARSKEVIEFADLVVMQIAAFNPDDIDALRLMASMLDGGITIGRMISALSDQLGESVSIVRFVRWEVGIYETACSRLTTEDGKFLKFGEHDQT